HVRRTLGPAQHGSKGDKQEFHQIVAGVVRPRIGQTSENLLEFAHVTPLEKWESPSESTFAADAIPVPNPYAIPLPWKGEVRRRSRRRRRPGGGETAKPQRRLAMQSAP